MAACSNDGKASSSSSSVGLVPCQLLFRALMPIPLGQVPCLENMRRQPTSEVVRQLQLQHLHQSPLG